MPDSTHILKKRPFPLVISPSLLAGGLSHLPGFVYLDSSCSDQPGTSSPRSRFSLIAARPTATYRGRIDDPHSTEALRECLARNARVETDLGFPTGGLIGAIDYDGAFHFGEYPEMLIFDHAADQWYEIGSLSRSFDPSQLDAIPATVPPTDFRPRIESAEFIAMVARAKEWIAAGDIYQVNLAHRFESPWHHDRAALWRLYLTLREVSPAPYSAYLELDGRTVLSASPELFLRISGRRIETRPIKGTRPRFADRTKDEKSAYDLITSPKEIAELIMITDLERNDLGMVSAFGSVEVSELLKLERYAQVFHLVSTVVGELRPDIDPVSAMVACFPGGSITGAPKKRAREIIAELEPVPRGLYTGSIGCWGFNGETLFNIAIRTAIRERDTLHFHTGAGIVADSDPEKEWEETLHKASGILRAAGSDA